MFSSPESEAVIPLIYKRLVILISGRLVVLSVYLVFIAYFQQEKSSDIDFIYAFISVFVGYLISLMYAAFLPYVKDLKRFSHLQILLDIPIATLMIFNSGGIQSPFSYIYVLIIISSGIFFTQLSTYIYSALCGFGFSFMTFLEIQKVITPPEIFYPIDPSLDLDYAKLKISSLLIILFTTSYLTGYLSKIIKSSDELYEEAKRNLFDLQSFNENVLLNIGAGIITCNKDMQIFSANPEAERILGLSEKQLINKDVRSIFASQRFGHHIDSFTTKQTVKQDKNTSFEITYKKQEPNRQYIRVTLSRYFDYDKTQAIIILFYDITATKKLEQNIAKNRELAMIGEVSAGIAHEIRNPLGSIHGSMQVMKHSAVSKLNEDETKLFTIIETEIERLNKIATSFLGMLKPLSLNFVYTDITKLISESITLIKSSTPNSDKIRIDEIYEEQPILLNLDKEAMKQVIWNILKNGIESIDTDGIIFVRVKRSVDADFVEIEFEDSGIGIDDSIKDMIFNPFFSAKKGGSGLGLAISREIVDAHNGEITYHKNGYGTVFKVRIPVSLS